MLFDYFDHIRFSQPWFFIVLVILPVLIYRYIKQPAGGVTTLTIPDTGASGLGSWKIFFLHIPFIFRILGIALIIIAMARPQLLNEEEQAEGEGIDIILCIDVSGSMTAQDLEPNRLEAAKGVAIDFVRKRLTDRIGIVIFSGESFTQCPLTTDHAVLENAINNIRIGLLEDGTAIGSGLGTSVDRLRGSIGKSRVVILLTDGENNGGIIDPKTAKEIAKAFAVKVYTIGVGTDGEVTMPVQTPLGLIMQKQHFTLNEDLLREIAVETGGKYFRARDNQGLQKTYEEIDGMEKSIVTIHTFSRTTEKYFPLVWGALILLFLEILLRYTVFKKFP